MTQVVIKSHRQCFSFCFLPVLQNLPKILSMDKSISYKAKRSIYANTRTEEKGLNVF